MINHLLRVAKSTNSEQKNAFLIALRQLIKSPIRKKDDEVNERESDILRMIFSNIYSPENFPNQFGQIDDSISFLVKMADTPYDNEEFLCLRLFKQLIKHKWGCKAFFLNQKAIKYVLDRKGNKSPKEIIEKRYSLINQICKEQDFIMDDSLIDVVVATQLQSYFSNGVWGSLKDTQDIPELATI